MKINQEFETSFRNQRDSHYEQCLLMSSYIYNYQQMHELLGKYTEQMNLSPEFFQIAFRALRTSSILWITKGFDKKESSSLYAFLNFIRENIRYLSIEYKKYRTDSDTTTRWIRNSKTISKETINNHFKILDSISPLIKRITNLRDKYHAHLDRSVINNRNIIAKGNQFRLEELDIFPIKYHEIIDYYSKAYDGESKFGVPLNWDDLENILKPLKINGIGKRVKFPFQTTDIRNKKTKDI